jgi:small-conductance mechanosensitive channel
MHALRSGLLASRFRLVIVTLIAIFGLWVRVAMADPTDGLPPPSEAVDRATPRRSMTGFLQASRAGDYARAAHFLDLRDVPRGQRAGNAPELARKLSYVLDRKVTIDIAQLPDDAEAKVAVAGTVFIDDEAVGIALSRVKFSDGVSRWVIARGTVSMIPALYAEFGPREWADRFPPSLQRFTLWGNAAWQWIGLLLVASVTYLVARLLAALLITIAERLAKRTTTTADDVLVRAAKRPMRLVLFVIFLRQLLPELHLTAAVENVIGHFTYSLVVIALAWFVIRAINVGARWAEEQLPSESKADLAARAMQTQVALLRRIAAVVVSIVAIAIGLLQFEFVRNLGISFLASAGLAGVVVGVAAQKSLSGIIAGIQLSLTQPIRIGDAVNVEKEFGWIEEINLTYVVVRLWDERRLIVPMTRFLEQPFENWSRTSGDILGTVFVMVDFRTPIDLIRTKLHRICEESPLWDQRMCILHVFEVTDRGMTLRALVSASSAARQGDLRHEVREKLLVYLQTLEGGKYLLPLPARDFFTGRREDGKT